MRRAGGLWASVVEFDNLYRAYRRARAAHPRSPKAAGFALNLERNVLRLQRSLTDGTYHPGAYRLFTVYERKPRHIAAAPFVDRVVHHALMAVVEPILDAGFIDDSYACRRGRGTHAAVSRYQQWARRYRYALKVDIRQYFASIDHERLKYHLCRRIKDRRVLTLCDVIIDSTPDVLGTRDPLPALDDDLVSLAARGRGLPIGNLTSQCFANLYLDSVDHWVKEVLRVPAYLRYVDDMVLLADDKPTLHKALAALQARLAQERLRLHPRKIQLTPTRCGLTLLGYRVFPTHIRLCPANGHRFHRRFRAQARAVAAGRLDLEAVERSLQAWIGHAAWADTQGLRQRLIPPVPFYRGADR